jgi:hypothetical protein
VRTLAARMRDRRHARSVLQLLRAHAAVAVGAIADNHELEARRGGLRDGELEGGRARNVCNHGVERRLLQLRRQVLLHAARAEALALEVRAVVEEQAHGDGLEGRSVVGGDKRSRPSEASEGHVGTVADHQAAA